MKKMSVLLLMFLLIFTTSASASSGSGEGGTDILWRTLNFVVLVALLYWLLADKIKQFFVSRKEGIRGSLERAEIDKREAQERYEGYVIKIDRASGEIEKVAEAIKVQGLAEQDKIVAEAVKMAEKIKEDTKARMEQEYKEASAKLRQEAVQLSLAMAEEILRRNIKPEDNEAIVKEYIEKVVVKQ